MVSGDSLDTKSARHRVSRVLAIAIPILTFTLGALTQQLIQDFLSKHDTTKLGLFLVATGVGIIGILVGYQAWLHARDFSDVAGVMRIQTEQLSSALAKLADSSGLLVEYVADNNKGASYRRAAKIIRSAQHSITFIDLWEPFEGYQRQNGRAKHDGTVAARQEFYRAIVEMLETHRADQVPFHRRVVQVPTNLLESKVPFYVDPPFEQYLRHVISMQSRHPTSCKVRISPALIRTHFIIVDQRFVILPILSHDPKTQRQARHGALFFDDTSGSLYACLRQMYQVIESRSRPLDLSSFEHKATDERGRKARKLDTKMQDQSPLAGPGDQATD